MSTINIKIPATAFTGSGPLVAFAAEPHKCRVPIAKTGHAAFDQAAFLPIQYADPSLVNDTRRGSLIATINSATLDYNQFLNISSTLRHVIADLMTKGLIEVLKDGAPLSVAAVLALVTVP